MSEPLDLATLVRSVLDSEGLSQVELAKRSGLSRAKIGQILNPASVDYGLREETLERLAVGLRLPAKTVKRAYMRQHLGGVDDDPELGTRAALLAERLEALDPETFAVVEEMLTGLLIIRNRGTNG